MTLIQRFGSALNLNIHFHMIFLDGVYQSVEGAAPVFRHVPAPTGTELQGLVEQIAERIGSTLERRGLVERDMENAWLADDGPSGPLDDLIGHCITYRIAVGPRAGQKLFTLQTVPARAEEGEQGDGRGAANAGGFSLHAGIDIEPHQRGKLERLCRYVSRPPIAEERLALPSSGQVRYQLKTPYRDAALARAFLPVLRQSDRSSSGICQCGDRELSSQSRNTVHDLGTSSRISEQRQLPKTFKLH